MSNAVEPVHLVEPVGCTGRTAHLLYRTVALGRQGRRLDKSWLRHFGRTVDKSRVTRDSLTFDLSCNNLCCMKRDSRLSDVLHVLLHMARQDGPATSEVLAKAMRTNPVVLRRTMAGLRDQGFVRSAKGHGGGWTLACDLSKVTMLDIYVALGKPALFAIGNRSDTPGCLVEKAVNANLNQAFLEAEQRLMTRFAEITLSKLNADLQMQVKQRRGALDVEKIHGGSA